MDNQMDDDELLEQQSLAQLTREEIERFILPEVIEDGDIDEVVRILIHLHTERRLQLATLSSAGATPQFKAKIIKALEEAQKEQVEENNKDK